MKIRLKIENNDRPGEALDLVLDLHKIQTEKKVPFWKTGSSKAGIEVEIEICDKKS